MAKHIVGFDENHSKFKDSSVVIESVKVVVHRLAAVKGDQEKGSAEESNNHVSIYLILGPKSSVRLNMTTAFTPEAYRTYGKLVWSEFLYDKPSSALKSLKLETRTKLTVEEVYKLVCDTHGYHRYQFADGKSGCRYWV
jgi:hypothetical protein